MVLIRDSNLDTDHGFHPVVVWPRVQRGAGDRLCHRAGYRCPRQHVLGDRGYADYAAAHGRFAGSESHLRLFAPDLAKPEAARASAAKGFVLDFVKRRGFYFLLSALILVPGLLSLAIRRRSSPASNSAAALRLPSTLRMRT